LADFPDVGPEDIRARVACSIVQRGHAVVVAERSVAQDLDKSGKSLHNAYS
jgi:hypothetical protein